ncbi:MAG TPA: MFS transporter [Marinilabiliales bacterium]|nr:MAG: sugar transporter [Bacteroidetes bacterium GWC2_40_13]HAZ02691.1 MFS transporter [Marinilabiliales bacterium]
MKTKINTLYLVLMALIVALGGFLLGFDSAVISGAVPFYKNVFGLDSGSWILGFSVGSIIAGAIIGNFIGGPFSDYLGRKGVLIITALLFAFCAFGTAFTDSIVFFVIARIIGGLGVGMAILVAPMYIAEISPQKYRGTLVSINQFNIVIGISIAYFSNYYILKTVEDPTMNWRWMLGVGSIPAVLYFLLLFFVPQSPRWLALKGRHDEAKKVLVRIGGNEYADQVHAEILENVKKAPDPGKSNIKEVFSKSMATILIIGFGIAFFQQITGINAIFYYAPMIFGMAGGAQDSAFIQAAILGLTNVLFTIVAMFLIDRLGRKPLLIIGSIGITLSLSLAAIAFSNATYKVDGSKVSGMVEAVKASEEKGKDLVLFETGIAKMVGKEYESEVEFFNVVEENIGASNYNVFKSTILQNSISMNAILVLIALIIYVASFAISLGPVMWALLSEIFPNRHRGLMISIVGTWNSIVSFAVATVFPVELEVLGTAGTFMVYAVFGLLTLLFTLKFIPETKGQSLEELEVTLMRH